jgi:hypothetical protein
LHLKKTTEEWVRCPICKPSYGFCPKCFDPGKSRERRPNGNDTCVNGHVYPSKDAIILGDDCELEEGRVPEPPKDPPITLGRTR